MKTSSVAIKLIVNFEGLNDSNLKKIGLQPKQDVSGIITAGWGRALKDLDGSWLKGVAGYRRMLEIYPDLETITVEEANQMLEEDLISREKQLNSLNLNLTQYQFDSLISLIFNIGFSNFKSSTLLRRIKGEKGSIKDAFLMWNRSDGKVYKGLILRRNAESTLFETGELLF